MVSPSTTQALQISTTTASSSVFEFLIFNKSGQCLFHLDFTGTINFEKTNDVQQRQKLVFGLTWSLKSFSQMVIISHLMLIQLSTKPLQTFRNYSTPKYKLHLYELPTGLKLILVTQPSKPDQFDKLQTLFQTLYVPLVSKNVFCQPNHKIYCKTFSEKVTEFLMSI